MRRCKKILPIILVICVLFVQTYLCKGVTNYDAEYRFNHNRDEWYQVSGYERNNYISNSEVIFEILDVQDEYIKYRSYSERVVISIVNFTEFHTYWIAPIGFYFVKPILFDSYYNSWKTEVDIYDVYAAGWYIGTNFTNEGTRKANNLVFELEIAGFISNVTANFYYNENSENFEEIKDDISFNSTVYIEYDANGVLLKSEVNYIFQGEIYEGERKFTAERVQEFVQDSTGLIFLMPIIVILTVISISRLLSRKRK